MEEYFVCEQEQLICYSLNKWNTVFGYYTNNFHRCCVIFSVLGSMTSATSPIILKWDPKSLEIRTLTVERLLEPLVTQASIFDLFCFFLLAWCYIYSFYIIILITFDNKNLNSFCSLSLVESSVQRCLEVLVLNNLWSQSMSRNTVATTIYLCLSFKSSLEIYETVNLRQGSDWVHTLGLLLYHGRWIHI